MEIENTGKRVEDVKHLKNCLNYLAISLNFGTFEAAVAQQKSQPRTIGPPNFWITFYGTILCRF